MEILDKLNTITETLPFIKNYKNKIVVVKYGGNAMKDINGMINFAKDISLISQLGVKVVVVHGGGPQINKELKIHNIEEKFVNGLRVSCEDTVNVAEMVLSGMVNKHIVAEINKFGNNAIGLSGKDFNLVKVEKITEEGDIGYVGRPIEMNVEKINTLLDNGFIPVISPISIGVDEKTYNVNADLISGFVAGQLGALRLLLLTDVNGVKDSDGNLISYLDYKKVPELIKTNVIYGGMIPKITTCVDFVKMTGNGAVILNGENPHSILLELLTDEGSGTIIK